MSDLLKEHHPDENISMAEAAYRWVSHSFHQPAQHQQTECITNNSDIAPFCIGRITWR